MRDELLLAAVIMESERHVAVSSSSDQPEIENVLGRQDPSSIPTARSHMNLGQEILQSKDLENVRNNALISEGLTKQTLKSATDMRWSSILHKTVVLT